MAPRPAECGSYPAVTMPPLNHASWQLGQWDIALAECLVRMTITHESGVQSPPGPSTTCNINIQRTVG